MKATVAGIPPALRATAESLRLDAIAAELIPNLREAGVRPILLKGPSIVRWLYRDGASRPYVDVDLLVAPDAVPRAGRVLGRSGFSRKQPGWQEVSYSWRRSSDGAAIDLHRSLVGVGCSPETSWEILSTHTESMTVAGVGVEVLAIPALALHVALHAAQHGGENDAATRRDLERALAHADAACWEEAGRLAHRLDATPAFAAGLRLHPAGAAWAARLGLRDERPAEVALHADGAPPLVLGLEHLAVSRGLGARSRFLARKLVPSPSNLRRCSSLARRGRFGLALAYVWRPLWIALRLPPALVAWGRVRRVAARARSDR